MCASSSVKLVDMHEVAQTKLRSLTTPVSEWYTFKEASEICGVSPATIRRRHTDGKFPAAAKVKGATGAEWRISPTELAEVADAEGWTMSLSSPDEPDEATVEPDGTEVAQASSELGQVNQLVSRFEELSDERSAALVAAAEASAQLKGVENLHEQQKKHLERAQADVEHHRSETTKLHEDLRRSNEAKAKAEADRDVLAKELSMLKEAHEQALSMVTSDKDRATEQLDTERARAQAAEQSLSWLKRRKLKRQ